MIVIITLADINNAIVAQINQYLKLNKLNIEFSSSDIQKEIVRPSFYTSIADNKTGRFNRYNKERETSIKIYYFGEGDRLDKEEGYKIISALETIFFDYLKVGENFYINIKNLDFDIQTNQGFLLCSFDLNTIEFIGDIDEDNAEPMEKLNYK